MRRVQEVRTQRRRGGEDYTPAQKFYWSCRREDKDQSEDKFLNSENFLKNHES